MTSVIVQLKPNSEQEQKLKNLFVVLNDFQRLGHKLTMRDVSLLTTEFKKRFKSTYNKAKALFPSVEDRTLSVLVIAYGQRKKPVASFPCPETAVAATGGKLEIRFGPLDLGSIRGYSGNQTIYKKPSSYWNSWAEIIASGSGYAVRFHPKNTELSISNRPGADVSHEWSHWITWVQGGAVGLGRRH